MGALVTLDLPADAPALTLPWIITFGPMDDEEEWEPVVCGPYERAHALALAEAVVADEDLMAVVEPLQPHVTVAQIQGDIAASRMAAENEDFETSALDEEMGDHHHDHDHDHEDEDHTHEPPSVDDIRAGFARIAAKLTS
ncbi:hypothetical protein KZZ52_04740 [Dactylosporangium sp. AC04546]|uniref:hypothetical protein n=1 Tax=Dactylosporangium sp. AC04546 TaxID=2862460 RepID=UPI001EE121D1|nr:hypothetical protein [Dactylosporangium sp. AC04546]WVK84722.1 hypothetical protein KZZ52_04740 [Dactylosporangium sp. AC04546]